MTPIDHPRVGFLSRIPRFIPSFPPYRTRKRMSGLQQPRAQGPACFGAHCAVAAHIPPDPLDSEILESVEALLPGADAAHAPGTWSNRWVQGIHYIGPKIWVDALPKLMSITITKLTDHYRQPQADLMAPAVRSRAGRHFGPTSLV